MLKRIGIVTASLLAAFPALLVEADEPVSVTGHATQLPAEPPTAPVKTGKERLSDKASDEQRVDNCKVPPELRGTTVRPDACQSKPETILTN